MVTSSFGSELLRIDHGSEEIDEQEGSDDADDDSSHKWIG
jgi:hypothetical protein